MGVSFFIPEVTITASSLDITNVPIQLVRREMTPLLTVIGIQQEPPSALLFLSAQPSLTVAVKPLTVIKETGESFSSSFPTFWLAAGVSPNLGIGGHLGFADWRGDDLQTFGLLVDLSWGRSVKNNLMSLAVNHLYGPDDFHTQDINLIYLRYFRSNLIDIAIGWSGHFTKCRITIRDNPNTDLNYSVTKNFDIHQLRAGLYWHAGGNHIFGTELNISRKASAIGLSYLFSL